jgi:hypothetical protein
MVAVCDDQNVFCGLMPTWVFGGSVERLVLLLK